MKRVVAGLVKLSFALVVGATCGSEATSEDEASADAGSGEFVARCEGDATDLVLGLDNERQLVSFDPDKAQAGEDGFEVLGTVRCSLGAPLPGFSQSYPYSMTVDRQGTVWAFYTSGEIFKISPTTRACEKTSWSSDDLLQLAFVADPSGKERLVTTLLSEGTNTPTRFVELDPDTFEILSEHEVSEQNLLQPNQGGTAGGELLGFRPLASTGWAASLDVQTGEPKEEWTVSGLGQDSIDFWTVGVHKERLVIFATSYDSLGNGADLVYLFDPRRAEADRLTLLTDEASHALNVAGAAACQP